MNGLSRPILSSLIPLLLSLPLAAAGPGTSKTEMLLDPGPDGAYALPLVEADRPIPLEFDAGETPFRLVELSFDPERNAIRATLRHTGRKPVTAWAIELTTTLGDAEPGGSSLLSEDWYRSVSEDLLSRFRAEELWSPVHEDGSLRPGQTRVVELDLTVPHEEPAPVEVRFRLSIPVAVFGDASYAGSPRLAREILGARAAATQELAYWSVRLDELVEGAASEQELLRGLAELRQELEAEVPDLPPAARPVRANLLQNLPTTPRPKSAAGSITTELQGLASWLKGELRNDLRHVPAELPPAPEARPGSGLLREKIGEGFDEDPADPNCECGGYIASSVTQLEFVDCSVSDGWRVDETWNFSCVEEGGGFGSGGLGSSGTLNGVGGCTTGLPCFPDKFCPPTFVGPSVWDNDWEHVWSRSVTNARVVLGFCTARCEIRTGSSLTYRCPCKPRPDPQCYGDGCPVLIETGAGGFKLTDRDGGVAFDIDADGVPDQVSWPVPDSDDAWLALDRDGNGSIDDGGELFGDATPQALGGERNGFLALATFDRPENGGNGDGQVSAADTVFSDLRLWLDRDHNGHSDAGELIDLESAGIVALELEYHASRRRDQHGNQFRYAAGVWYASGARRLAVDVFLLYE